MAGLGIGIAAAAAAALIALTTSQPAATPGRPLVGPPAAAHRTSTPLIRLADYIKAHTGQPAGNATLVIRTQAYATGQPITVADLYADSGAYYFAPAESRLPAQIAAHHDISDGMFHREVAAALYAVNGDLATARQRMINATGSVCSAQCDPTAVRITDNYLCGELARRAHRRRWQPPGPGGRAASPVHAARGHRHEHHDRRQPALTLTAGSPAFPGNYHEALTINASTGVPVAFAGGTPGQKPDVTITYQVFRVTLAAIAAGSSESIQRSDGLPSCRPGQPVVSTAQDRLERERTPVSCSEERPGST